MTVPQEEGIQLTEAEHKAVTDELLALGYAGAKCHVCGSQKWAVDANIIPLVSTPTRHVRLIGLVCQTCKLVNLHDAGQLQSIDIAEKLGVNRVETGSTPL